MKKRFALLFVVVMASMTLLTGCKSGDKKECLYVIEEFQYACNNLDVDAMLRCMDPDVADPIRIVLAMSGMDASEQLGQLVDAMLSDVSEGEEGASQILGSIVIEPKDVEVGKKTAVAYCRISFSVNGVDVVRFVDISLRIHDDTWYITSIMMVDEK